jgi:NDP-sugar pyrophosphorylase family protein
MPAKASDNVGELSHAADSSLRAYGELSRAPQPGNSPLMFTGIQILEPAIFSYIPAQGFSHTVTDVYPQAIARGESVVAHIAEGAWYEMSTIERYLDISLAMLRAEHLTYLCGENCLLAATAKVKDSVLWNDSVVEEGAQLDECVVGEGVRIPAHSRFQRAAIVRAELVRGVEPPPKALAGEFIGENFVVPLPR